MIGAAIMVGAVAGYRSQKRDAEVKDRNPDAPWLWRKDWAESRALSNHRNTIYGWWIGTVLTSMLFVPMAAINLPPLLRSSDPKAFLLLGFCLLPALLLLGALRATIRRETYGKTYFEFASLPFSPGKRLSGQIHVRLTAAEHGIDLRLSAIRRIVTGSGKNQSISEAPLWQQQKNLPQASLITGPLGTSIPVDFEIPEDAYETNHEVPRDQVLWRLYAQADVPGVDYKDDFEVPVFRSSRKAARASAGVGESGWSAAVPPGFAVNSRESQSLDVPTPANPKVRISTTADGATEFYFPPFRNRGRTLILLLVTVGWTGMVYVLAQSNAPRFFALAFALCDLLLVYGSVASLFGTARIIVGQGRLISRRGTIGNGTVREIPFNDIESIHAAAGVQQSSGVNASYSICLKTRSGSKLTLADGIADRDEARSIVAQIEKLAGLKLDTSVVLENFGRDLGPPPQRGSI